MKVYLDDERDTPTGWVRVYTAPECIRMLDKYAEDITDLSLDHDLGPAEAGTGYDVMVWIEEQVFTNQFPLPTITFHTANPVGRANMQRVLDNIDKRLDAIHGVQPDDN